jgi:hypothetical protein
VRRGLRSASLYAPDDDTALALYLEASERAERAGRYVTVLAGQNPEHERALVAAVPDPSGFGGPLSGTYVASITTGQLIVTEDSSTTVFQKLEP